MLKCRWQDLNLLFQASVLAASFTNISNSSGEKKKPRHTRESMTGPGDKSPTVLFWPGALPLSY